MRCREINNIVKPLIKAFNIIDLNLIIIDENHAVDHHILKSELSEFLRFHPGFAHYPFYDYNVLLQLPPIFFETDLETYFEINGIPSISDITSHPTWHQAKEVCVQQWNLDGSISLLSIGTSDLFDAYNIISQKNYILKIIAELYNVIRGTDKIMWNSSINLSELSPLQLLPKYKNKQLVTHKLTKREKLVYTLITQGIHKTVDIATKLNISCRTVEDYLSNLRYKLDCKNITELSQKITSEHMALNHPKKGAAAQPHVKATVYS
ncbi:helix-turn-helix domain-containing protein [Piscirickettsia litoralis]|uniref:HTH luxR-type domain-containing protein n=1 Tax=Piscirickettsia litoralis TaxID=1891921 RepID=A0ABX3A1J5_9GAMM|nr:helix-turn-helix transcriptional regulator [Piscirickettsia litoralis]ODN41498.1 hypothetical protein BGC07_15420 [Piscirickettsia litoralis]